MKISCQSCQAKYTIADEKVLGKIVKIRCKKCGATIVINGNEQEAATAAFDASAAQQPGNAVYDYTAQGGGESWTVNVSDGDQRTMTTAEIAAAYSQSVVNDETYCWKDGMGDWLPLREIPELHGAANAGPQPSMHADSYSQPPPPPQEDQPTQAGFSSLFGGGGGGGGADAGASLFGGGAAAAAAAPAAAASAPAARRAGGRAAGGADLFGSAATAGSEQDVMSSAAAQGAAGGSMTGQRNENSVLFSLSALTANAPKEDAPMPQGDGSGLIDIRALSAGMGTKDNGPNKADDIMNLGGGGAFSAALAAPVLAPAPADMSDLNVGAGGERKKGNAGLIIGMIAGLAIFGLLVGGGIIYALKAPPAVPTAATATAAPTETATATTTTTATAPTTTVADTGTAATAKPPGVGTTTGTVKTPTGGTNTGGGTASTAVVPTATAAATGGSGKCGCAPSDFECAMKCSAGQSTAPTATATAAAGGGAAFDRGAAASTLGSIASSLGSCKKPDGPTGPGKVKVTFQPSGTVSAVEFVEGSYAGTSVGGCILAKFRGAHIPPFGGSAVPANKSFVLN